MHSDENEQNESDSSIKPSSLAVISPFGNRRNQASKVPENPETFQQQLFIPFNRMQKSQTCFTAVEEKNDLIELDGHTIQLWESIYITNEQSEIVFPVMETVTSISRRSAKTD